MRIFALLVVAALWLPVAAAGGLPGPVAPLAGLLAVLVLPGWLLWRRIGRPAAGSAAWIATPATSLVASLFMISALELGCAGLGLGMNALLAGLAIVSALLAALGPAVREEPASETGRDDSDGERVALALFLAVACTAVALAWFGENIARDRMWYAAWVSDLAHAQSFRWTEPFFGTDYAPARFAHNTWLTGLGALSRVAGMEAPTLFDHLLPVFLTLCTASAAWMLADALFGGGASTALAAIAEMLVLLATRYPFFSPDRYPFFGRLAEDKFVALVVLMPVAIAVARRLLEGFTPARAAAFVAACTAVAFSHAIVQLILIVTIVPFCIWMRLAGRTQSKSVAIVVAIVALTSIGPALAAWTARGQIVESPDPAQVLEHDTRHPVVRSHLRMDRLEALPRGGPIVDPALVGEPFLLVSLIGLAVACLRRRESWAALLLIAAVAHLTLAFTPFVSPWFGRLIVPWMAYRALWGVPFGLLFGIVLIEVARVLAPATGGRAAGVTIVAVAAVGMIAVRVPWNRFDDDATARLRMDPQTRALLDEIHRLPRPSRIAAATGLAELIPAYTGRYVLAVSDRGTIVFTGSRRRAERRLIGNAALLGLRGGSKRLRNRVVSDFDITHTVYEEHDCDRAAAEIYRNDRYTLCAERYHAGRRFRMRRTTAVASATPTGAIRATLRDLLKCTPAPQWIGKTRVNHWSRDSRWNAEPVIVECTAEFPRPTAVGRFRIALHLPKANEALVYRAHVELFDGSDYERQGVLEFRENPNGELLLPAGAVKRVAVRLVPAFLPYLNVRALELRN